MANLWTRVEYDFDDRAVELIETAAQLHAGEDPEDLPNAEYLRGQVELIADTTSMWGVEDHDHKKAIIEGAIREKIREDNTLAEQRRKG